MHNSLQRFIDAQATTYKNAQAEVGNGRKQSHWMWFIFPQVQGLGYSETARYYAIKNLEEAAEYLRHPVLGSRLIDLCQLLLSLKTADAHEIFGSPDDVKLKSSMTLFAQVPGANPVFQQVLDKYYKGEKDKRTLAIIAGAA
jgi:uncharacterized protein (DUF1810 family)